MDPHNRKGNLYKTNGPWNRSETNKRAFIQLLYVHTFPQMLKWSWYNKA